MSATQSGRLGLTYTAPSLCKKTELITSWPVSYVSSALNSAPIDPKTKPPGIKPNVPDRNIDYLRPKSYLLSTGYITHLRFR